MSNLTKDPVTKQIFIEDRIKDDLYIQVLDSFDIFSEYVWHEIGKSKVGDPCFPATNLKRSGTRPMT